MCFKLENTFFAVAADFAVGPDQLWVVKRDPASGSGEDLKLFNRQRLLDESGIKGGLGTATGAADGSGFANVKAGLKKTSSDGSGGGIGEELGIGAHDAFDLLKEVEGPAFAVAGGGEGVEKDKVDRGVGEKGDGVAGVAPVHGNGLTGNGFCVGMLVELLEGGSPVEGVVGVRLEGFGGMANNATVHFEGSDG